MAGDHYYTDIFNQNLNAWLNPQKRRAMNEGGTSSSKTISIMQALIQIATGTVDPLVISVVSESLPHLKRGAIRDFKWLMGSALDPARNNKSDHIYRFPRAIMEFFPADDPDKMRGGRRDILFINECNNVAYNAYRELDIRTRMFTFLDWNPVSEFWIHEHKLQNRPENAYIHSTYMDAYYVLPTEVVANIESNRHDKNWWNVYGLGLLGKIEGLVYPNFEIVDELPERGEVIYGMDFGYSNDPTTLCKNVINGTDLHSQELIYEKGLTNDMIADKLQDLGLTMADEIIADSAEPKSIEEIYQRGFNIKPVRKGPDSVRFGHQVVNQYKQHWTKDSLNAIKEQRNFRYVEDKDGRFTDKTTHQFSHMMDGRRYAMVSVDTVEEEKMVFFDVIDEVMADVMI